MKRNPVIVVGGGIGGLSAAIVLAARGLPVQLFNSSVELGGKIRQITVGGAHSDSHASQNNHKAQSNQIFRVDSGPTVLTMQSVFEDLFASADAHFQDYVTTYPLEVLARHAWSPESTLDLYLDQARSIEAIGDFAGAAEANRYQRFCIHTAQVFNTLELTFIKRHRPNPLNLVLRGGLSGLPGMLAMKPFSSMWQELTKQLKSPQLQQLFARYSTYCGASPYLAPAVLMLIAHVEQRGVWSVKGGMQNLAIGCEKLAVEKGCEIHHETKIDKIEVNHGRADAVITQNGERYPASAVIFNGDPSALAAGLLGQDVVTATKKTRATQRSLSAVTFSMRAKTSGFVLDRHNVFFSENYRKEFDDIFEHHRLPSDPTVYVCAQDRGGLIDTKIAGAKNTKESQAQPLFCLVNAPAMADISALSAQQIQECKHAAFARMQHCGLQIVSDSKETIITSPENFQTMFPGTGGALYGRASHHWHASFSRPGSNTPINHLYLAGGATHPGPGVPMASLSGQLAAQRVLEILNV